MYTTFYKQGLCLDLFSISERGSLSYNTLGYNMYNKQ